jgi:hypothetical protein
LGQTYEETDRWILRPNRPTVAYSSQLDDDDDDEKIRFQTSVSKWPC